MLSAVSLLLVGCANYDSDINRIDEELDRIENTRIKSLSEQIDRINVSLPELERTDKDLKDMIKSLEGTAGDLQKAIAENGTKIEAVNAISRRRWMSSGALTPRTGRRSWPP